MHSYNHIIFKQKYHKCDIDPSSNTHSTYVKFTLEFNFCPGKLCDNIYIRAEEEKVCHDTKP